MRLRAVAVLMHRYVGLAITIPLIVAALTGSAIAFNDELERWLSPELFVVADDGSPLLDPLTLRERVEAAVWPHARVDYVALDQQLGRAVLTILSPGLGQPPAPEHDLSPVQAFVDPRSGVILGQRTWGEASLRAKDLMPFVNRLHFSLAMGAVGSYALGVTALLWTLDCFVGVYLTLPRRLRPGNTAIGDRHFWPRWKVAWQIQWRRSLFRLQFDLHRALSLWAWALLLILAWSSVSFNLPEVYTPVTSRVLGLRQLADLPLRPEALERPRVDWKSALDTGRALMAKQAKDAGFMVLREEGLGLDRAHGTYSFTVKSTKDLGRWAQTSVVFDADSASLLSTDWPAHPSEEPGDVIGRWLTWLHMVVVFGVTLQIVVCVAGLAIVGLTGTGVYIWVVKRNAHRIARSRMTPPLHTS